jgi:hypothetical protein
MQVDVEIALLDATAAELTRIQLELPQGFQVEDRSDTGWGVVITTSRELPNNFSKAIDDFLTPLSALGDLVRTYAGILRVGVFYGTVNCTIRLESYDRLMMLGLPLEISTYPSDDDN